MAKRKRRAFTREYKAEVVGLIRRSGRSIGAISKELGLTETAVRRWVEQAEIDQGDGASGALTTAERDELSQLRRRVKQLEMEREILNNGRAHGAPARRETPDEPSIASREEWPSSFWCSANP